MRKLGLRDAFALARIIKAANLRPTVTAFAEEIRGREEKDIEAVGFEFVLTLLESVSDEANEQRIYKLYADIKGVTPEEVSLLDFGTIKADMKELVEKNDLKGFFTSVSALMSKQSGFSSVTAAAI